MRTSLGLAATALTLLALAGCNKAQTPSEVQHDVSTATTSAAENNAQAGATQADVTTAANKDLGTATQKADSKVADAAADTAVTLAEGKHKVAAARCESMAGDAQKACKDEADAALEMAKAKAKSTRAAQG
jgi:hypothetical protein